MDKPSILHLLIIILLSMLVSITISEASEGNFKIDPLIIKEIREGKVNIIVKFYQTHSMSEKHFSITSNINGLNNKTQDFNYKRHSVNENELVLLLSDKKVEKIFYDYPVKSKLYDSIPLVNADQVWNTKVAGQVLTGKGQTVCIIDTGVDYTHPDLGGCLGEECKVVGGWNFIANDSNIQDDNGHGTHVAGIAAANGAIKGIAPEANILSVKVLDDKGEGWESDVITGIEFCTVNAAKYNVSVISMSLGTDCNKYPQTCSSNFCDNDSPFTDSINHATLKNISVVVATGNDGEHNLIASPACVKNAIRVGSSDKDDKISSFSNRNSLTKLLAPGRGIYSTFLNNGYQIYSGTSMATPHLAGAILILNQFLTLNGKSKTPLEIENALSTHGKNIHDSSSERNYSRLDLFAALNSIPILSLGKLNNTLATKNLSFSCNVTDWQVTEISFYVSNETNTIFNESKTISHDGEFNFHLDNLTAGKYYYICLASNLMGKTVFVNSTFEITNLYTTLISPQDGFYTNKNQEFICEAESQNTINKSTLIIWNETSIVYNSSIFEYNFTEEGEYHWNCFFEDQINTGFALKNFSLTYDITKPEINLISPFENETLNYTNVIFSYNVSDNYNLSNCSLILNAEVNLTDNFVNRSTNSFSTGLNSGNHTWAIICNDLAGNSNTPLIRNLTITVDNSSQVSIITQPPQNQPSSNTGSGGGGGSSLSRITSNSPTDYSNTTLLDDNLFANLSSSSPIPISTFEENSLNNSEYHNKKGITGAAIGEFAGILEDKLASIFIAIILLLLAGNIALNLHIRKLNK